MTISSVMKGKLDLIVVPGDLRVDQVGIIVYYSAKKEVMCPISITSIYPAPTMTILAACGLLISSGIGFD